MLTIHQRTQSALIAER